MGRNKKSMTVDLTRLEGREVFYRLVAKSDVFIENNSADVVRRLASATTSCRSTTPD
jgi:formyl-CoA transferase